MFILILNEFAIDLRNCDGAGSGEGVVPDPDLQLEPGEGGHVPEPGGVGGATGWDGSERGEDHQRADLVHGRRHVHHAHEAEDAADEVLPVGAHVQVHLHQPLRGVRHPAVLRGAEGEEGRRRANPGQFRQHQEHRESHLLNGKEQDAQGRRGRGHVHQDQLQRQTPPGDPGPDHRGNHQPNHRRPDQCRDLHPRRHRRQQNLQHDLQHPHRVPHLPHLSLRPLDGHELHGQHPDSRKVRQGQLPVRKGKLICIRSQEQQTINHIPSFINIQLCLPSPTPTQLSSQCGTTSWRHTRCRTSRIRTSWTKTSATSLHSLGSIFLLTPASKKSAKSDIIDILPDLRMEEEDSSPKFKSAFQSQSQIDVNSVKEKSQQKIVELGDPQEMHQTWKQGALVIIDHITKFIKQLKTHSSKQKFKLLNTTILKFIDDKSSDPHEILYQLNPVKYRHKNSCYSCLTQIYEYFIEKIPVFEPDSTFKIFWDTLVVLLIVINVFYIPIRISFKTDHTPVYILFEVLPSYIFIIDILINFNTAYYSKGVLHKRKKHIIKNYIFGNFLSDMIIVVIPFILSQFSIPYTQYFLLLRITRIRPMVANLEEILNFSEYVQAILELIKSAYFIILVSHLCACAWHLIGEMEYKGNNQNWLVDQGIEQADWETKYIYSFYFSIITTVTVGYGDIGPVSNVERIFVVIITLFICGVFGYTISSIGEIFKSLQEKEQVFRQKMKSINSYLKQKQLSQQLQLQVKKYFQYYYTLHLDEEDQGEVMMQQLTKKLKEKVAIDLYYSILSESKIFKNNISTQTIERLCVYVKEKKFAPEEQIITKGEMANKLIYVALGEISLETNNQQGQSLKSYYHGQFVGEREFITNQAYDYSMKTEKFTIIYYINYEDFRSILKDSELEKIYFIRDNLIFNKIQTNFGQFCQICQWTHHFIKQQLSSLNEKGVLSFFFKLISTKSQHSIYDGKNNQGNHTHSETTILTKHCNFCKILKKQGLISSLKKVICRKGLKDSSIFSSQITEQYLKDLGFLFKFNITEENSQQSNFRMISENQDSIIESDIEKRRLKKEEDSNLDQSLIKKEQNFLNSELSMGGTSKNIESFRKIESNVIVTPRTPSKKISRSKTKKNSTFFEVVQRNIDKKKSKIMVQSPSINSKRSITVIEEEKNQGEKKEIAIITDSNDLMVLDLKHETTIYYPQWNYTVIIQNVNYHYELKRLKQMQSSRRSILGYRLGRLKSLTHRTNKSGTKGKI